MVEPNMTLDGMDEWTDSDAYKQYEEYHTKNVYGAGKASSKLKTVVHRAREVIRHGENSKYYDKVTGYNARAKGSYEQHGAGSKKFDGVAKNIAAMRCWGLDVYYVYTD